MAGFGFTLKFWTLQQNNVSEKDITIHQYYGKDVAANGEYYGLKKQFVENRDGIWMPRNKRPEKLRESIKVFEDVLKSNQAVCIQWSDMNLLQVLFSSGLLAHIQVSQTMDVMKITFEKSFVGKMTSPASTAVLGDKFVCFASENQTNLTHFTMKPDIKMATTDLPGPQAKLNRNLCMNMSEDMLICWWQFGAWQQTANENERINMVLLRSSYGRLEVLSSIESENDLINVMFSKINSNQVLTLEKSYSERKEFHIDSVTYECTKNKIQRLNVISFPSKSGVLSCARNSTEDKLAVGCSDGSVVLYDLTIKTQVAIVTRSSLVPTITMWIGSLIFVGSGQGELKLFDSILNPVMFFDLEEQESSKLEISEYLTCGSGMTKLLPSSINNIMLVFNGGPFTMLSLHGKLDTSSTIEQHIYNGKVTEAIKLLCSLNWNYECDQAYHGLLTIADFLLQKPLDYDGEVQLEATLASFYAAKHPISDSIVLKCRTTIGCYARRFFHHLLRFQRFEKAFLLAKDIASSDLFLDIYFAAKDLGELQLAKVAKVKADEIIAVDSTETDYVGEMEKLAVEHSDNLFPSEDPNRDYLGEALEQEFAGNEGSSSTLKVTNLGYV